MNWLESTTLAVALIGAVLGIINTWQNLIRGRVRLRVIPKLSIVDERRGIMLSRTHGQEFSNDAKQCLSIEVVNLSAFPVTISEVGFGRCHAKKARQYLFAPRLTDGGTLPKRLEAREALTAIAASNAEIEQPVLPYAYAETDCGHIMHGTSPALSKYLEDRQ